MQTVVYRTQGILPLPPKLEAQKVSSTEAGLTGLKIDSSGCIAWAARADLHLTTVAGTPLLSGTVPLTILSSTVRIRSSAKLPPPLYTGRQTTLIYSQPLGNLNRQFPDSVSSQPLLTLRLCQTSIWATSIAPGTDGELARLHASFILNLLLQLCIKRQMNFLVNSASI